MSSRSAQTEAILIAFTVLSSVIVALRIVSKYIILRVPAAEDYLIVIAIIFSIITGILQINQVKWGVGKHFMVEVSLAEFSMSMRFLFASIQTYNIGLTLTKFSILWTYNRVFSIGYMPLACKIAMAIVVCYGIECFFTGIFTCTPIEAFWNFTLTDATCLPKESLWYANAGLNIVTDFTIALLPIPVLKTLKVGRRQRYVLIFVFGLGLFVCVVSILRLNSLIVLASSQDPTWDQAATTYWSCIELNLGIICASIPTLKPIIARISPSLLSTSRERSNYRKGSQTIGPTGITIGSRARSRAAGNIGRDQLGSDMNLDDFDAYIANSPLSARSSTTESKTQITRIETVV